MDSAHKRTYRDTIISLLLTAVAGQEGRQFCPLPLQVVLNQLIKVDIDEQLSQQHVHHYVYSYSKQSTKMAVKFLRYSSRHGSSTNVNLILDFI